MISVQYRYMVFRVKEYFQRLVYRDTERYGVGDGRVGRGEENFDGELHSPYFLTPFTREHSHWFAGYVFVSPKGRRKYERRVKYTSKLHN